MRRYDLDSLLVLLDEVYHCNSGGSWLACPIPALVVAWSYLVSVRLASVNSALYPLSLGLLDVGSWTGSNDCLRQIDGNIFNRGLWFVIVPHRYTACEGLRRICAAVSTIKRIRHSILSVMEVVWSRGASLKAAFLLIYNGIGPCVQTRWGLLIKRLGISQIHKWLLVVSWGDWRSHSLWLRPLELVSWVSLLW
jgi:hypothetical protein